ATTYVVNSPDDVIENIAQGEGNAVKASIDFTLPAYIDYLALTGGGNLVAQGNDDATNTLIANTGNDTLISGTAVTNFQGGNGDDTFVINNAQDSVIA